MPSREQAERPEPYAYGSRGPAGADLLARKFGYSKFGGGIHPYVSAPSVRHDPPPSLSRVAMPPPRSAAAAARPAAASRPASGAPATIIQVPLAPPGEALGNARFPLRHRE